MIMLPNGCRCSDIKIHPTNWAEEKLSTRKQAELLKKDWYLQYRFYDPTIKEGSFAKGKLRIVKGGVNEFKNLKGRQLAIKRLLEDEKYQLIHKGYNPITKQYRPPVTTYSDIYPTTPFIKALELAYAKLKCTPHTKEDIKSVIKYSSLAATEVQLDIIPIADIKRKHIKVLLDATGHIKLTQKFYDAKGRLISTKWTANTYNTYRKYLNILFNELLEMDAIEENPVTSIRCQKVEKKLKRILTRQECERVDSFARNYDTYLWRFIHIFFHSGARRTEIFRVQGEHVNLERQKVKYLIKKGKSYEWVERTIKDVVLPFWRMAMKDCGPKDYVFSVGLQPGTKPILPEQITRRWKRHMKDKLGIVCDLYSLKHLNTDQTADMFGIEVAAEQNSHKSTAVTIKHYAVGEKKRQHERLKQVNNKFA